MSRFRQLAHTLWHCQYHIVWVPKYRLRILTGQVGTEVGRCTRAFCAQVKCEVIERNIQHDQVHLLVLIPPKLAVSAFGGTLKGRTAIRIFGRFQQLKRKPYWGNHFWAPGYCADTGGLEAGKIRRYGKYQEHREKQMEQRQLPFASAARGQLFLAFSEGKAF